MRSVPLLLVLLIVVVTAHIQQQPGGAQTRRKRHVDPAGSSGLLRRSKRRWVLTTIVLEENDVGPFPKKAGDLFNDQAVNYNIKYLISGPGVDEAPEIGLFHINDLTGEVFVNRPIDREKTPEFVVRFDATDRLKGEVLDKSLIFNVEVRDKNDNAPRFSQSVYNLTLKETANLDSPIFQVTATDDDKEDTPNSHFDYYLIKQIPTLPNVKFTVDPKNGLIRGEGCLNYEASNFIRLIVGAKDKGVEPLYNTSTVNIRILDANNNMPVFTTSDKYELSVREGEVKDELLRLKVEDKDTPKTPAWRAKYKILIGNEKENYNLTTDPETNDGILSMVKPLDFEGTPTKTIVISVENEEPYFSCDGNKLRISKADTLPNITVLINVIDTNDAPIFTPEIKVIREKEGVKLGTILGTFTANDPDRVPNKIRYTMAEDPAGWLTVNENTGVVSTLQELDRESPYVNGTIYKALVYAIDDGDPPATGTGTIILQVSDINDNTPELVTPYMSRCDNRLNVPFLVEAIDKDAEPFAGPFQFRLADGSRSMTETWQIKQVSDNAAEISMLKTLTKGNYTIPLDILEKQGAFRTQTLNVRVCSCPDQINCEKMAPASYQMGAGGIAAIFGALLLILLALCLLMCFLCGSGKKKNILPNDEGNQTLIMYNEESGSALSQASPATLIAAGNGTNEYGLKEKEAVGRVVSNSLPRSQYQQWEGDRESVGLMKPRAQYQSWETDGVGVGVGLAAGAGARTGTGMSIRRQAQNGTWTQQSQGTQGVLDTSYASSSKYMKNGTFKNRYDNVFVEKIGDILNKRLHGLPDDDDQGNYKPRIYAYEGELDRIASMESIHCPDDNMDFSFLDQFDPKFARLEEICKK
ncbi:cadherin-like protein 26 [Mantella aurantiaca]